MKIIASVALPVVARGCITTRPRPYAIVREPQSQSDRNMNSPGDSLGVSVITGKYSCKLYDQFTLHALLTNTGRNTLYVYGILDWGYSASFTLHVTNATGEEVHAKSFDDSINHEDELGARFDLMAVCPVSHLFDKLYNACRLNIWFIAPTG